MKIFCIGAHKTGTTSLTLAMSRLGYNPLPESIGYGFLFFDPSCSPWQLGYRNNICEVISHIKTCSELYDFFEDIPFCLFDNYKLIDREFPDSKFILTIRDSEDWFNSILRWVAKLTNEMAPIHPYEFIYGVPICYANKKTIIELYEKRNNEIFNYFSNQSDRLLIMNITAGDGFEKLCRFLNKEIIPDHFPHENINK